MTIDFDSIPITTRTPGVFVEFDASRAVPGLAVERYKVLVIAPLAAAGTATALVPFLVTSDEVARVKAGHGSPLANMLLAFRAQNRTSELWGIGIDTSGGTKEVRTLTITGTATEGGTLALYLGGRRVPVTITSGDNPTAIAAAISAAITGTNDHVWTSSPAAGVVTLTAKVEGRDATADPIVTSLFIGEETPAGVGTVAEATTTPGVGVLTIQDAIDAIGDDRYHIIVFPQLEAADYTALEAELATRWGPIKQNDGHAFGGLQDTIANLTTAGNLRNSPHVTLTGIELQNAHNPNDAGAGAAGQVAEKGNADPARPFQTLAIVGIHATPRASRFTQEERDTLLHNGISTVVYDEAGDVTRIETMISTYQTNAGGAPDTAYLHVNTLLTLSLLRSTFRNRMLTRFPRAKLVGDDANIGSGQATVTPGRIKAESIAIFRLWEGLGLVEGIDQFVDDLVVERNATDPNRLDVLLPPDLANQLRRLGVKLAFRLEAEG